MLIKIKTNLETLPAEDVSLFVLEAEHENDRSPGEAAVTRTQAHELIHEAEVVTAGGSLLRTRSLLYIVSIVYLCSP